MRIGSFIGILGMFVAGCAGGSGDDAALGSRLYTDETFGYSLRYPRDWHLDTSMDQFRITSWETTVANFDAASGPSHEVRRERRGGLDVSIQLERDDDLADFPPDGVALRIFHFEGGPFHDFESEEATFPLALDDFTPSEAPCSGLGISVLAESRLGKLPRPLELNFGANGWAFSACVWIGQEASTVDRARLERVVASLRFPPLTTGATAAGERFDVLGYENEYPVRSAHRVHRQGEEYYLVHAPGGFYALRGGCRPLEIDQLEFRCPSTGERWSRTGRPLADTASQPLAVLYAKVGQDGHVLVAMGVEVGMDKRFWRR